MAKGGSSKYPGGAKRLSGLDPLSYVGVEASQPPDMIQNTFDPTTEYNKFRIGTIWTNTLLERVWALVNLDGAVATWIRMGGIGDLRLNGNVGQAQPDANFEIDVPGEGVLYTTGAGTTLTLGMTANTDGQLIIGSTAGLPDWGNLTSVGTTIDITEGSNTLNIEVNTSYLGARIFDCDVGSATVAGQTIVMAGGLNINTSGASNVVTINTDVFPVFDNVQLDDLIQGFVEIDATGKFVTSQGTDGQIIVGATGARAQWANLTSNDNSIEITEGANTLDIGVSDEYDSWGFSPYVVLYRQPAAAATLKCGYDADNPVFVITLINGGTEVHTASDPAGTWTSRTVTATVGAPQDIHCEATIGNVILGASQYILHSTDATGTWTRYTIDAGGTLISPYRVMYGNGVWVITGRAAGAGAYGVYTSTDPTAQNFVANTSGITGQVWDLAYGNSTWVIVGVNGTVYTASDPTGTWTSQTNPFGSTANVFGVAYSSSLNLFVAAAQRNAGEGAGVATSPDGVTWTARSSNLPASGGDITDIVWDSTSGIFVISEVSSTIISRDGKNWIPKEANEWGFRLHMAAGGGVIIGGDQANAGRLYYSL